MEAVRNTNSAAVDSMQILTGFHAVEERIRAAVSDEGLAAQMQIFYGNPGPRVKKILEQAKAASIKCNAVDKRTLDSMVQPLPELARDHRGILIQIQGESQKPKNLVDFDQWLNHMKNADDSQRFTVLILDSVTDPHNTGAILRSADQFGVSLVIMPERHSANKIADNDVIARASAGASAWVPVSIVTNLVRTAKLLKDAGFWIYGADAGGTSIQEGSFAKRTALVMGSEGNGISRLLEAECDTIVSIPTCGKIDSLNVSVAAGVLMYEIHRQSIKK